MAYCHRPRPEHNRSGRQGKQQEGLCGAVRRPRAQGGERCAAGAWLCADRPLCRLRRRAAHHPPTCFRPASRSAASRFSSLAASVRQPSRPPKSTTLRASKTVEGMGSRQGSGPRATDAHTRPSAARLPLQHPHPHSSTPGGLSCGATRLAAAGSAARSSSPAHPCPCPAKDALLAEAGVARATSTKTTAANTRIWPLAAMGCERRGKVCSRALLR